MNASFWGNGMKLAPLDEPLQYGSFELDIGTGGRVSDDGGHFTFPFCGLHATGRTLARSPKERESVRAHAVAPGTQLSTELRLGFLRVARAARGARNSNTVQFGARSAHGLICIDLRNVMIAEPSG
jgi:hypothetical protein